MSSSRLVVSFGDGVYSVQEEQIGLRRLEFWWQWEQWSQSGVGVVIGGEEDRFLTRAPALILARTLSPLAVAGVLPLRLQFRKLTPYFLPAYFLPT